MAPGILSSDILSGIYSDKFNLTFFLAFGKITWPQNPSPYQVSPNHHLPFCQGQCLDFERHLWSHDFDPWLWDCKTKSTLFISSCFIWGARKGSGDIQETVASRPPYDQDQETWRNYVHQKDWGRAGTTTGPRRSLGKALGSINMPMV